MTCPNCGVDAPESELCANCGAVLAKAPRRDATPPNPSPLASLEETGVPGGCITAVLLNLIVFFAGGYGLFALNSGGVSPCIGGRIALGALIALALAIVGLLVWRSRGTVDFWFGLALGVFVPFLPCTMWAVGSTIRCPGP